MTSQGEETDHCDTCPTCLDAVKEREAEQGERCKACLDSFDEPWPVQSEERPGLCRRCASAVPVGPRGARYGTRGGAA